MKSIQLQVTNKVVQVVNVLNNDTLDNSPLLITNGNVLTPDPDNKLTLRSDGIVELAPNTPAGTYTLTYEISKKANSRNCKSVLVAVKVTALKMTINARELLCKKYSVYFI